MAKRNGNGGNGHRKDETLGTLKAILDVQRDMAKRLGRVEGVLLETRQEQRETNKRLATVEDELHAMNGRFDNLLDTASERDRRLEADVRGLGERVAKLEARGPEPR